MTYIKLGVIQVDQPWVRWWIGYRVGGQVTASTSALPLQYIEVPTGCQITGIYLGKPEFGTIGIPLADLGYVFLADLDTTYTVDVNMLVYPPEISWHIEGAVPPPTAPIIAVNPASLTFTVLAGGNVAAQSITIFNSGAGAMSWQATVNNSRVSLSATTGNAPSTITVSVNIAGLPPGQYAAIISIYVAGATNSPLSFPVIIVVNAVTPPPIGDTAVIILDQIITDIAFQTWWLGIVGPTGTIATPKVGLTDSVIIPVPCIISGVELGDATGWGVKDIDGWSFDPLIRVETPGTYKLYVDTITYPWIGYVTLVATPPPVPAIAFSPASLSFTAQQGAVNPTAKLLNIQNVGGGTLSWQVTASNSRITASPSGGSSTGEIDTVIISLDISGMTAGNYNADFITIWGTGLNPQTVPINVTITAPNPPPTPVIGVMPTSLTFTAQEGSQPVAQTLSIHNAGGGTLNWQAVSDNNRIGLSPSSGTGTSTVSISLDTVGLSAGQYVANITLTATGASPIVVPIAITITAAPPPEGPVADFSWLQIASLTAKFTNRSVGAISYAWNFGDGTGSGEVSPEHKYDSSGTYDVTLVASSATESDYKLETIAVTDGGTPPPEGKSALPWVIGGALGAILLWPKKRPAHRRRNVT